MSRRQIVRGTSIALAGVLLSAGLAVSSAGAQPSPPAADPGSDVRELTRKDFTLDGQPVVTPNSYQPSSTRVFAVAETPPVGTVRQWLGLDDFNGRLYRKDYTLRGVGENIEVWVANDIAFPAGDCRRRSRRRP